MEPIRDREKLEAMPWETLREELAEDLSSTLRDLLEVGQRDAEAIKSLALEISAAMTGALQAGDLALVGEIKHQVRALIEASRLELDRARVATVRAVIDTAGRAMFRILAAALAAVP